MEAHPEIAWHARSAEEAERALASGENGLAEQEARRRLSEHGPNRLPTAKPQSAFRRFLAQFHNLLVYVLLAAAGITAILGEVVDAAVILGVVLANAVLGLLQENKAEKAIAAIRSMLASQASVIRDGRRRTIAADELVAGDLVLLEAGDRVPADLRLVRSRNLQIAEAVLTGESVPRSIRSAMVPPQAASSGSSASIAFSLSNR